MMDTYFKFCLIFCVLKCVLSVEDRYYPRYHLAPPSGWMNDPNGFCVFNGEYHMFYQYNPETSLEPGIAHWGHAKSRDLFTWEHLPIALYPDRDYDITGAFSGSALVEDGTMYLYYTGNVNRLGETPAQYQALATSTDGNTFTKHPNNPIIVGEEFQPDIRDPKVWRHGDTYYMVIGNAFVKESMLGRVLLYTSNDKLSWEHVSILGESDGFLGFMWECPDFFELDGHYVLLFSPQGVDPQGDRYKNLYQTGYIVGNFDYETNKFTPLTSFRELDHGHDFYASQTTLDDNNRRVVVGWFSMWEQYYPERPDGFAGILTIPRELSLTFDYRLIQKPVVEIVDIRGQLLHSGQADSNTEVTLSDKTGEVNIVLQIFQDLELIIESTNVKVVITYDYVRGLVTLDRGGEDGVRRTNWRPSSLLVSPKFTVYIDASSVELFCGDGEVTFSSRFFPDGAITVRLGETSSSVEMTVYDIQRTVPRPS